MGRIPALASISLVLVASTLAGACGKEGDGGAPAGEDGKLGWAVVVGVSQYRHFPALAEGVAGAQRMARLFETSWRVPRERMRMLLDDEATLAGLRDVLTGRLPRSVSSGDFVLVYLKGYRSTVEDLSGDEEDRGERAIQEG